MDFVMNKEITRGPGGFVHPLNKPRHLAIGKTLFPQKMKLKSLNVNNIIRQKGGKKWRYNYSEVGLDKARSQLRLKQKHKIDKRLRNKFKRIYLKEN